MKRLSYITMNEIRERYALRNLILIAGTLANGALFLKGLTDSWVAWSTPFLICGPIQAVLVLLFFVNRMVYLEERKRALQARRRRVRQTPAYTILDREDVA